MFVIVFVLGLLLIKECYDFCKKYKSPTRSMGFHLSDLIVVKSETKKWCALPEVKNFLVNITSYPVS